eukprot:scaffold18321_cov28-Tisochrysis_lutea.AAC.1
MTISLPSGASSERIEPMNASRACSGIISRTSHRRTSCARAPSGSSGTTPSAMRMAVTFATSSRFARARMARIASERTSSAKTRAFGSAAAKAKEKIPVPAPTSTTVASDDRSAAKKSATLAG